MGYGASLLDITPDEYHRRDGLSSTLAKIIVESSTLHAWQAHPCYGGKEAADDTDDDETVEQTIGTVVHRLVLGKGKSYRVLEHKDWRKNEAKADKAATRAEGLIPILRHVFDGAQKTAVEIMKRLVDRGIRLDGTSEQAMEWHEHSSSGPVLCRGMMDHLSATRTTIYDLKIVKSAAPAMIERSAETFGYAIARAAYTSGVTHCFPELAGRVEKLFIFCERYPPYAMNVVRPDGAFRELGERRWRRAVEAWGLAIKQQRWFAYGDGINTISPPAWALAREPYDGEE
jgi:hypothetical protein